MPLETTGVGVPAVVQLDRQHLGGHYDTGLIPSPAQWLRIQHHCSCSLGSKCGSNLILGLGTPCAAGWGRKEGREGREGKEGREGREGGKEEGRNSQSDVSSLLPMN